MRNSLPMIQALLIMAVIILTPIVTIFSGYSLKTIVTLIFVQFALVTTSFWWELARWLDSFFITILYNSPGHTTDSLVNWNFLQNDRDDLIMSFVLGMMFLILPGVWIASMSWAGVVVGNIAQAFSDASRQPQAAGSEAVNTVKKVAK